MNKGDNMGNRKNLWTYLLGTVFVFFGISILLDNLGIICFKEIWKIYWPVLIILVGIIMIIRRSEGKDTGEEKKETFEADIKIDFGEKKAPKADEDPEKTSNETGASSEEEPAFSGSSASGEFNQSNVFGNIHFSSQAKDYPGGSISNVFGDMKIDLREIDFQKGTKSLNVSGVFGSIHILLPQGIPVKFTGSTVAGSVKFLSEKRDGLMANLNSSTPEYDTAGKRLKISASLVFGDIEAE
jgi:predicted membrane protein